MVKGNDNRKKCTGPFLAQKEKAARKRVVPNGHIQLPCIAPCSSSASCPTQPHSTSCSISMILTLKMVCKMEISSPRKMYYTFLKASPSVMPISICQLISRNNPHAQLKKKLQGNYSQKLYGFLTSPMLIPCLARIPRKQNRNFQTEWTWEILNYVLKTISFFSLDI